MNKIKSIASIILFTSVAMTACKPDENLPEPKPVEQELITTVRLTVTNNSGFNKVFNYKVDNGFGSATQGQVTIDDVELAPETAYNVKIEVLNEAENPAENITEEVLAESHHHLFVLESNPTTGAGALAFSNGNKDDEGMPLNQEFTMTSGAVGTGVFTVTLKHEPTDKNATTPDAAGGETDAQAVFPVKIQ